MTLLSDSQRLAPAELEAYWMPFTANRQFKSKPRMMARAEGMYYWTDDGRKILDGFAGLWCCNAGHGRKPIVEAIQRQGATRVTGAGVGTSTASSPSWRRKESRSLAGGSIWGAP